MPYFKCKTRTGEILKFLIDTGSSKNYIKPDLVQKPIDNKQIFFAKSIAGDVKISKHTFLNLFGLKDVNIKFFILPNLKTFHGILGNDTLKELKAVIHTQNSFMTILDKVKIKMHQLKVQSVNNITASMENLTNSQKQMLASAVKKYPALFAEPEERLTYTTAVIAEIRTTTDDPVFTRYYPFPMALKSEVEKQVSQLLHDGIIRPSRSPYNSPVWIVPKKPDSTGAKQYRMVIDYRKLNTITIADRYPIPEINEVTAQLGRNKFFTVLDLKSGFHQIPLKESDIEKTAFSINNGKYEFTRLPFGLKNAPSIFQRTLDDILRDYIGKSCYVYIDDIIIFSENQEQHAKDIEQIFSTLSRANMKVQLDKCKFFSSEVEFLGFKISSEGIKTNTNKVKSITEFPVPKTLKELRSFLGLSGYYRRFIQGYAQLAKPLTNLLRGEGGRTSKNQSSRIQISLNNEALESFDKIKKSLISKDVILAYPDYKKPFDLTTDASNVAIGAVLEQDNRPLTFISRTLTKTEENYAANEKEMLAIVWALGSLRNYLYGHARVRIFTDHQPLTFALSTKNNNSKMKRWKSILEEYNHEIKYKPGKTNVVADALSRAYSTPHINLVSTSSHSNEGLNKSRVMKVDTPINVFKNQILLQIGQTPSQTFEIIFPTYHRHVIIEQVYSKDNLKQILKKVLNPSVINCIKTDGKVMDIIQEIYPLHFKNFRTRFTQLQVEDVTNETRQEEIIISTHKRAHRNQRENKSQILEKYYFPKMANKINKVVRNCTVCKVSKYDRHPTKQQVQPTPIPEYPGQIVHIDIFITENKLVLTSIDKFSKYAQVRVLKSRAVEDIRQPLREILFSFGLPETVVFDNEKSFNSVTIGYMLEDELKIKVFTTPPYCSSANGQVERFHSTLIEIMRCLKKDNSHQSFNELLHRAVYEYNLSIHSTTTKKPIEVFFGHRVTPDLTQLETARKENIGKLKRKQAQDLEYHNKFRQPIKVYTPGEIIYVKQNKRIGSKLNSRYKKEIVAENKSTTILTKSGKTVHKALIKN